jgi:uncharacterized damage-inducible protein DinB
MPEASRPSDRAHQLATTFERANAVLIAFVEQLSDADWGMITSEGWTVAACAHHVAAVHEEIARFVQRFADGTSSPHQADMGPIHESNAKHASEHATCAKGDVLTLLRSKGAAAAAIVRALSDEQLDSTAVVVHGNPAVMTQRLVDTALIGHLTQHFHSIEQAVSALR